MSERVDLSNLHTANLMCASPDMNASQTHSYQDAPVKIIVFFYTCGRPFHALQMHCIITGLRHDCLFLSISLGKYHCNYPRVSTCEPIKWQSILCADDLSTRLSESLSLSHSLSLSLSLSPSIIGAPLLQRGFLWAVLSSRRSSGSPKTFAYLFPFSSLLSEMRLWV